MQPKKPSTWKSIRNIFDQVHLYAGLISGLVVVAVCLSGTIYVYNTEIREFMDSELYYVKETGERKSADELKHSLEINNEADVIGLMWNEEADRSVQFTLKKSEEEGKGTTYYVNPYSGAILGNTSDKTQTTEFMGYMFSLHRWLLLDRIETPILESIGNRDLGRFINGVATLLFLLGVITGIVIWVPNKVKSWKQGLKIKWSGNWKRINHDLHNSLAFYSLIFLFIMSVTGPFWSYTWYREGWQKTWDTYQAPVTKADNTGKPKNEAIPELVAQVEEGTLSVLSLEDIMATTNEKLPYKGNIRLTLPSNASEPIGVSKYRTGFFARAGADQLTLSSSDLSITEANLFSDLPFRQQVGRSVKSLHIGDIFGQFSKFLWFVACLIATSLPITGTLIWWNKRKKKPSKKKPIEKRVAKMA
ncbi:putative iron-regulated membrane protein [Algoriphagus ratkowskyi]|uniref:PepSY domain-containing protein n=1 Tax=Algoriphagus ratkowskyi TaxID=57028 RepID=A0A2W7SYJ5_9BACT|nr:PepSY-associated TM helix domain-containing protein [Algoriphagus ratkowskyi]PZX55892.1 putative iron-regulated membrane protein [Algoriphagus ratkowskyi]TXD77288.1 PepSY domain-containing protein [Algoriphagus ratkowskyi]